jgi:CdiI N-terminal domain
MAAMFNIAFTTGVAEEQEEGWYGLWGRVTLGDHVEDFVASLSLWGREDYEHHWREAAVRLLDGEERTAFVTSAFQFWFAMWHDEGDIRVHDELLTAERLHELGPTLDTSRVPYELLWDYQRTNEEGEAISEWRLHISDIEGFLGR